MSSAGNPVVNRFVHRSVAQRYAAARPYFHPIVVKRICAFTGVSRFAVGIDVACGTGQSARALAEIADRVAAIDVSREMIAEAQPPNERVRYHIASAERIPFADGSFDVATVGLAFHWFDQSAFLIEAKRVLKPGAWLVVYNSGFAGEMKENVDFKQWAWEIYPRRFPTPARRSVGVSAALVEPLGFALAGTESFAHEESISAVQLTEYLMTQTNVIAAVESGGTPLAEAAKWILNGVAPFFRDGRGTMKFGGSIWYLRAIEHGAQTSLA